HHEIHDDEKENERHKKTDAAARTGCSRTLCLSQKRVKHAKNWRAHLKRETAGRNRSLSFATAWQDRQGVFCNLRQSACEIPRTSCSRCAPALVASNQDKNANYAAGSG